MTHPKEDRRVHLFHRQEDVHCSASAANRLQERLDSRMAIGPNMPFLLGALASSTNLIEVALLRSVLLLS
ncbi:MAG: hypothetical protein J2P37_13760 [Ktedonobacteraceae bacterium]|nr:hypothetical protein [Ktedonobacteraceae bacterium]MBO0791994.1 hypothetical protein [Ktedonobacteraceae bacterium]